MNKNKELIAKQLKERDLNRYAVKTEEGTAIYFEDLMLVDKLRKKSVEGSIIDEKLKAQMDKRHAFNMKRKAEQEEIERIEQELREAEVKKDPFFKRVQTRFVNVSKELKINF